MEEVVAQILTELKKQEVTIEGQSLQVHLKVGALAVHSEAATRQAYEVLVKGTPLEGSHLNLEIEPIILACNTCGYQGSLPAGAVDPHDLAPITECPRCGAIIPVQSSRGVEAIELQWD